MIDLKPTGLIAILRGIKPDEAEAIAAPLVEAGFGAIEVPLNSPEPMASIAAIARAFGHRTLVGAGTVLTVSDVERAVGAGAKLIVSPNANRAVIEAARALDCVALPGVGTVTEAFQALEWGASALKMFPAEGMPPEIVKAWLSVLPRGVQLVPTGGVTPEKIATYRKAGAAGFGIGGALYKPGVTAFEAAEGARVFVEAWRVAGA
jgi:2-dehydro-3-deoxyphosphogalactonate aldolase